MTSMKKMTQSNNVTDDFVSESMARQLKDFGFPFENAEDFRCTRFTGYFSINPIDGIEYFIPTLSQVRNWLEVEFNIHIAPKWYNIGRFYTFCVDGEELGGNKYNTYNDALRASIEHFLSNNTQTK